MDKKTLNTALTAGRYLYLLNLVFTEHRDKISRLRNFLEQQVALLVLHSELPGMDGAKAGIVQFEAAVSSLLKNFNMLKIAQFAAKGTSKDRTAHYLVESPRSLMEAQRTINKLLDGVWLEVKKRAPETKTNNLEFGQVIHRFNSVMRNGSWLDVLVLQGIPVQSATPLAGLLGTYIGTPQGRAELEEKYQTLVTVQDAKPSRRKSTAKRVPKVPESVSLDGDYFAVNVRLNAAALLTHPLVVDFLTACRYDEDAADGRLGMLLAQATADQEVPAGGSAQDMANGIFRDFLVELEKLGAEVIKKRAERDKERRASRQQHAIEALRGIDRKLLAELKANPDLLNKV